MTALGQGLKITYLLAPSALLCLLILCGTIGSTLTQREECLRLNHQCCILQHSRKALAVRKDNYSVVTTTDFWDAFIYTSGMSASKMQSACSEVPKCPKYIIFHHKTGHTDRSLLD